MVRSAVCGFWAVFIALSVVAVFSGAFLAHADTPPTLTTTVVNGSNAIVTSAPIGTPVQATAVVASSTTSVAPAGTVDFNFYNNLTCSGTPTTQAGVALVAATAQSSTAQSSTTTVPASGLSYLVNYNSSDASNASVAGTCVAVTPISPNTGITTALSTTTSVHAGSTINDTATLINATTNATGTVTYTVYTNNVCTTGAQSAGAVTVGNALVPNSNSVLFEFPGAYYWQAVYSGDQNNIAATSTCGSEALNVVATTSPVATPMLTTTLSTTTSVLAGSTINDTATLTGAQVSAGGTVTYNIYNDSECSALNQSAGTVSVSDAAVPNSSTIVFSTPGTYYWQASYSGDVNNAPATSTCGSEALTVTSTTSAGPGTISGEVFNDLNKNRTLDSGEPSLPGFTIWLHAGSGYNAPIVQTTTSDSNGDYSFSNLSDGTYFVEEDVLSGYDQISSDTKVALTTSSDSATVNFANIAKVATSTYPGEGKGKCDGDNDADDANCPVTLPNQGNDNGNHGLHLGWFNGLGNFFHDHFGNGGGNGNGNGNGTHGDNKGGKNN